VRSCHFCQTFKPRVGLPVGKLRPIPPPREMFHTLGIDHLGPFKSTTRANKHLVVCIDYLSRWMEARPVASTGVDEVLPFLEEAFLLHHGTRIISDKGPCFTSFAFSAFCDKWNIKHVKASADPETNGLVERINSSIASTLAAFVNFDHSDWDERIARAVFSINTSKQSTTEITSFELVFGRPAVLSAPLTHEERVEVVSRWRKTARRLIIIRQKKSKLNYDRYRKADPTFKNGELVLIARRQKTKNTTKKFIPGFVSPYQVYRKVSPTGYAVEDLPCFRRKRLWRRFNAHVSQIRRYSARRETEWCPDSDEFGSCDEETDHIGITSNESETSIENQPDESSIENQPDESSIENQPNEPSFENQLDEPSFENQPFEPKIENLQFVPKHHTPFVSRSGRTA
jgi:hypothetical protein